MLNSSFNFGKCKDTKLSHSYLKCTGHNYIGRLNPHSERCSLSKTPNNSEFSFVVVCFQTIFNFVSWRLHFG